MQEKKPLRHAVAQFGERMGYTIVPNWKVPDMGLEATLRQVFHDYGIEVVLDIGANTGQYRDFLRQRVGFEGIVHSFEPLTELVDAMRARAGDDRRWHVHPFALGAEDAVKQFNVMAHTTFSSFRTPDASYSEFADTNRVVRTLDVHVRRLDDLAPTLDGLSAPGVFVKIDTQGFDLEVIAGGGRVLAAAHGMQFELAMQHIYQNVPGYAEMLGTVQRLGFDVAGMFPITVDSHLRVVEFDCINVRASALPAAPKAG